MTRVTVEDVRTLVETSLSDGEIKTRISIANALVDQIATHSDLPDDTLETIELLWAAHLVESADGSSTGDVESLSQESFSVSFATDGVDGFDELAMLLDPTGILDPEASGPTQFDVGIPDAR